MALQVWRVQCDITGDDPVFEIFASEEGRRDTDNVYLVKRSQLPLLAALTDIAVLNGITEPRPWGYVPPPTPFPQPEE